MNKNNKGNVQWLYASISNATTNNNYTILSLWNWLYLLYNYNAISIQIYSGVKNVGTPGQKTFYN